GFAAYAGDRHSHGPGRAMRGTQRNVRSPRIVAHGRGYRLRTQRGFRPDAPHVFPVVPGKCCRSTNVWGCLDRADRNGRASELPAVPARGGGGSHRVFARRMSEQMLKTVGPGPAYKLKAD